MVDELEPSTRPDLSPIELAKANARLKAEAVALRHSQGIILAADTIVFCEGKTLGKPADLAEARQMLGWLSNKTHEVITAAVWLKVQQKIMHEHVARTRVTFRLLDEASITAYLTKVHVLDKAGAYAFQEHGYDVVERIEGSKTNVIGLPMEIVNHWWSDLR